MTEERKGPVWIIVIGVVAMLACAGMLAAGVAMLRPAKVETKADDLRQRVEGIRQMPVTATDCAASFGGRTPVVMLVLGQSNAANHAGPAAEAPARIPLLHDGLCGLSAAPLPGGTGAGGSLWPAVHQGLGGEWLGHPIVWQVIAVDSSSLREWLDHEGALRQHWEKQLDRIKSTRLPVAAVLWQQGEADARDRSAMADYRDDLAALRTLMGARGVKAPWFVAKSTYCPDTNGTQVREAIRELTVIPDSGFLAGPDTDAIGPEQREGCHFSAAGAARASALWVEALKAGETAAAGMAAASASAASR